MRVLIVEDEQTLRESIVEQLQQHGFTVDAAADGEEGLYCGREYALDRSSTSVCPSCPAWS